MGESAKILHQALDRLETMERTDVHEKVPKRVKPGAGEIFHRTETPRGDNATEPDCAISDNSDCLARRDFGGNGRVMARPHHVGKRKKRGHQRVIFAHRQHEKRSVGLRDTDSFSLCSDVSHAEEAPMDA